MIDTKMKMGLVGAGLVAILGSGCGTPTVEKPSEARVIDVRVPAVCAEVKSLGLEGKDLQRSYAVIDCRDTEGYKVMCSITRYHTLCYRLMEKR